MDRRQFVSTLGAASLAAAQQAGLRAQSGRPPNFLFLLFDKCRRDAIGAYGLEDVHTPNLDRLAAGGVRFENCYTPQALCGPARASIITGDYPHVHGLRKNVYPAPAVSNNVYPDRIPDPFRDPRFLLWNNFIYLLHNAGYRTAHIGKWHLGAGNPGFFDTWRSFNSGLGHWVGEPHKSAYRPDVHTDHGIEFIEENASRPFFLYQSYYPPHEAHDPPKRFLDHFAGKNVEHAGYHGLVSNLDWNVGRLVETLEKHGILDNTFIIITTEHGRTWIDRPGTLHGMSIAYDEASRIPLILHGPSLLPRGKVWQSGVSLVDLMPTILDAANVRAPGGVNIRDRSLLPALRSGDDRWRGPLVLQNISQRAYLGSYYEERAIRTERWKLILRSFDLRVNADPLVANELYDMRDDPAETRSLFASPDHRRVVEDLAGQLKSWGEANADALSVELASGVLAGSG